MAEAAPQQTKPAPQTPPVHNAGGRGETHNGGAETSGSPSPIVPLASVTLNNSTPFAQDHRSDYQTGPRMTVSYNRAERMIVLTEVKPGGAVVMIPVEGVKYMVPVR